MNVVRSFVNYAIIRELCDRMRFEVDCAKSHHRVISEGLYNFKKKPFYISTRNLSDCFRAATQNYR